jgi:hypothetical protein
MIESKRKAPEFVTKNDDQGENSIARERQLALWQAKIAREAQQQRGIDALHRVLSEPRGQGSRHRVLHYGVPAVIQATLS